MTSLVVIEVARPWVRVLLTSLRLGLVVIEVARVWVRVLLTCLRRDLVVIEVARVWVRVLLTCLRLGLVVIEVDRVGSVDLFETRSGYNRSCPSLGQGIVDLSETSLVVMLVWVQCIVDLS